MRISVKRFVIPAAILAWIGVGVLLILSTRGGKGQEATAQVAVNRIVSLAPNLTEVLFELGLGDKVAGVTLYSDYPPAAKQKPKMGTFWQPDTEAVIAARPDLVITLQIERQKEIANSLKRLGYRVLTLKVEKIEELFKAIEKIGIATGSSQRASELVENISSRLDDLKSKYNSSGRTRALWVIQPEPLRVAGRSTFINELVEMVGGENAIGPTIQQYPPIGTEELLACDAEVIIQSAMGDADIDNQQRQAEIFWSKWPSLPAVRDKKVYVINSDAVLRLGPRLPQGAEMVARCLHSDEAGR
jgi:iron complex transport system substrate-binding protein